MLDEIELEELAQEAERKKQETIRKEESKIRPFHCILASSAVLLILLLLLGNSAKGTRADRYFQSESWQIQTNLVADLEKSINSRYGRVQSGFDSLEKRHFCVNCAKPVYSRPFTWVHTPMSVITNCRDNHFVVMEAWRDGRWDLVNSYYEETEALLLEATIGKSDVRKSILDKQDANFRAFDLILNE